MPCTEYLPVARYRCIEIAPVTATPRTKQRQFRVSRASGREARRKSFRSAKTRDNMTLSKNVLRGNLQPVSLRTSLCEVGVKLEAGFEERETEQRESDTKKR